MLRSDISSVAMSGFIPYIKSIEDITKANIVTLQISTQEMIARITADDSPLWDRFDMK